jgi:hypothetical protein
MSANNEKLEEIENKITSVEGLDLDNEIFLKESLIY